MDRSYSLGHSGLQVSRLGVGAMTWGDARGLARLHPAKLAYGGAHGRRGRAGRAGGEPGAAG